MNLPLLLLIRCGECPELGSSSGLLISEAVGSLRAYKARRWAPSIGLRLPINTSISQFLRLAVSSAPS